MPSKCEPVTRVLLKQGEEGDPAKHAEGCDAKNSSTDQESRARGESGPLDVESTAALAGHLITLSLTQTLQWKFTAPDFLCLAEKNKDPYGEMPGTEEDID